MPSIGSASSSEMKEHWARECESDRLSDDEAARIEGIYRRHFLEE
jgi:hypothetical protein